MIVGGSVTGCEAARICAIRGHKVSLYEKTNKLGGNIVPGGVPDFKEDDRALMKWYENELEENDIPINFKYYSSKRDLYNELKFDDTEMYLLGDVRE